jgi:NADH dehydrogenase
MDLVVGATGHLGGLIANRLLEKGSGVRVLVREGSDYSDLEAAGAELAIGDLKDRHSLTAACRGAQRVIATATAALRGGDDTVEAVDRLGYRNLITAAEANAVQQFVFVSAHGFAPDSGPALSQAKGATEAAIRESALDYTILKPTLFMEAWISMVIGSQLQTGRRVTVVGDPDLAYGFIASKNVADLALAVLGLPAASRATIPWSTSPVSYRQIVQRIEQAIGEPIVIDSIPPGEAVPGLPPIVNQLWSYAAEGGMPPIETLQTAAEFGIRLITPEDYIQQAFGSDFSD